MTDSLFASLRGCGLFRALDDGAIGELAESAAEERHDAGAALVREGDAADAMFVVLEGAVQVFAADEAGREIVLARLEAGEHFGEQALLPGSIGRRNASVRALNPVRLARISRDAFTRALAKDGALHGRLTALGAEQAASAIARMSSLARALDVGSIAPSRRVLRDGEVLFRQGEDSDALYLVRS